MVVALKCRGPQVLGVRVRESERERERETVRDRIDTTKPTP